MVRQQVVGVVFSLFQQVLHLLVDGTVLVGHLRLQLLYERLFVLLLLLELVQLSTVELFGLFDWCLVL